MTDTLPISVVVPAFNAEATLEATLASVFAQTRLPLEVIVIDDGSNDGTADVARAAGALVIRTPNGGVASARNAGMRAAKGEWIALLDADDLWHPNKLAAQWSAHERDPKPGLIITDFDFVAAAGSRASGGLETNPGYRRARARSIAPGVRFVAGPAVALALCYGNFILPSTVLFRREIALEREALFLSRDEVDIGALRTFPEDSEWCLRFCRSSDVLVVTEALVDYRASASSLSAHPGRVRYGDVTLMDRIVAHAERYPPGVAALARERRPAIARSAVTIFVRRLEIDAARAVASDAWRASRGPLEALLLALVVSLETLRLRGALAWFRSLWRKRLKGVVGARRE